jgi:hypothetical protein
MERTMSGSNVNITTFAQVQKALDDYCNTNGYTPGQAQHHVFWHRGTTPDEQYNNFVTGDALPGVPIISANDGPNSNVVLALSGLPPFDGSVYPQMAQGGPPWLDQPTIDAISTWITNGAKQNG